MTKKILQFNVVILLFASLVIISTPGCNGDDGEDPDLIPEDTTEEVEKDSLISLGGRIFSIPSPYQTTLLIKELESTYNGDLVNPTSNTANYTTTYKKALNLGVYGADLGYISIYEQNQQAIQYFAAIQQLATEMRIADAFDPELISQIEANIGNQDELMGLVTKGFRSADNYLQTNEQPEIGALILAGGCVEGLHFAIEIAKKSKHQMLINRIGEQKATINTLVELLRQYYHLDGFPTEIFDLISELAYDFDGVEFKYKYEQPDIDATNKITTINSKSEVIISDVQLAAITDKVERLRKLIVE